MDFTSFYKILKKSNTFMVTSHIMPDGDSIGSALALSHALSKIGKNVITIINDEIPQKYQFLPGIEKIRYCSNDKFDTVISLDCGDEERLGFDKALKNYGETILNIDHHKSNTFYGDINIVDSNASSTGEIIYNLVKEIIEIDYDIALCIYTSIVTDTGSMRYSNTTPSALRMLAELIEIGVKPDFVSRQVFEKKTLASMLLVKSALDTLDFTENGKIASMVLTKNMLLKTGAKEEDIDGVINYARQIEGVEIAILFTEKEEMLIKIGFRSNEWVDVSEIAEALNGGGHARASGCILKIPLPKAKELVLKTVKKYIVRDIR